MAYAGVWALIHPERVPKNDLVLTFWEKLNASRRLIPVLLLIGFVIGSIYLGWATATEAAAFGVAGSLVLSAATGSLTWTSFSESLNGRDAHLLHDRLHHCGSGLPVGGDGLYRHPAHRAAQLIRDFDLSPYWLLVALTVLFVILGCFLDGISVVVLTTAVILPMVEAAGIDLLWFGIYVVLVVEMSQITPPVGFNLFVLQGLTGRDILYVARAALPFFLLMVLAVALLMLFPEIATWLPAQATARP